MDYSFACKFAGPGGERPSTSSGDGYTRLLSLALRPSPLFICFFEGLSGIKGQIAAKMASDAVIERAIELWAENEAPAGVPLASYITREAVRLANARVYEYAHVMGAGGQMGASGFVGVYDGQRISAVRVGNAQGYIFRGRKSAVLFESTSLAQDASKQSGLLLRFVGANAQVLVDCASSVLCDGDIVLVSACAFGAEVEELLQRNISSCSTPSEVFKLLDGIDLQGNLMVLVAGKPAITLR